MFVCKTAGQPFAVLICVILLLWSSLCLSQPSHTVSAPPTAASTTAPASAPVTAADLANIQKSLEAMRSFYETRIQALEGKVETLQKKNVQLNQQVQAVSDSAPTGGQKGSAPSASRRSVSSQAVAEIQPLAGSVRAQAASGADTPQPAPAPSVATAPTLARGIVLPKIGVVTPEISLILDGKYSGQSQNPELPMRGFLPSGAENIPRGFSLGESELSLAGTVDNLFRAEARFVLSQNENGTSITVEEAFFETLGLPDGLKFKGGKFFSDVGYLNNKHPHEWDFVDLPLAYQAFLGGQLNNTGIQAKWVAPLDDIYLRFGGEYAQGTAYPNSNNYNQNKPMLGTLFAKAGGDIGVSSSWQSGLSFVRAGTGERPRTSILSDTESFDYNGTTSLYIADFVYKWAPNGNASQQNLKLQGEFFWNTQNGSGTLNSATPNLQCQAPCLGNAFANTQKGFYTQAVYQFMPRWRIGYRYDQLYSGSSDYGFASGSISSPVLDSWNPNRNTVMLDWANSEYSMFRLQLARDTSLGPGLVNNQVFLQYIMSLGAHGAHRY